MAKQKTNYLNKKDMIKEIIASKNSYSSYIDEKYHYYDIIVDDLKDVTDEIINTAKAKRVQEMYQAEKQKLKDAGATYSVLSKLEKGNPEDINTEDLVIRLMTFDHIPEDENRVKNKKSAADYRVKVNFPPYKHYIMKDGEFVEVGRSHWEGGLGNGNFCQDHGNMTKQLCRMIKLLVEKYSQKGNFRGYTYNDEMRSRAILQLMTVGLQFNEFKSDNPFAYYTRIAQHAFIGVLNSEKKAHDIRDDILIMMGVQPSFSRQVENELEYGREDFNKRHNIKETENIVMVRNVGRPKRKKTDEEK